MGTEVLSHNRIATLNFWQDKGDGSVPEPLYINGMNVDIERTLQPTEVEVTDVTGNEDMYTLDNNAFRFGYYPSKVDKSIFLDRSDEEIRKQYYKECEELLVHFTGGKRAVVFAHRVRSSLGDGKTGPVARAHVDHSDYGSEAFLKFYLANEAEEILASGRRWQIVNVWRPLKTIQRDPLAVADVSTFTEKDFVCARVHYPTYDGESLAVVHNPNQRWYYKYHLTPNEVVLIKNFDSDHGIKARRCPHSAIVDPEEIAQGLEPRSSCEVRAFVFY